MDDARREAIDQRWNEIEAKLEQARLTGQSPLPGVDLEFFRGQLLEELDELEYAVGLDYFECRR